MKFSMFIVYVIAIVIVIGSEIKIKGKVRKRFSAYRRHRAVQPPCNFNETLIADEWSLMEAIKNAKFIFTGKVLNVRRIKSDRAESRSNLYRVYLRRVLKGSLSDLRMFIKVEGSEETLSGSTLAVERPQAPKNCAPGPRPRLSAIFLSGGQYLNPGRGPVSRLQLLTDPVPLSLYHLDRINSAVKGGQWIV
ncbi:hypothetical protein ACJJTC_007994 [Scirpophaga incertulas]